MTNKPKIPSFFPRTKAFFIEAGYTCATVEYFNSFDHKKHDMFGFVDIYAFKAGVPDVAIQSTTSQNISHHVKKIAMNPIAETWLKAGKQIRVIGWEKINNKWKHSVRAISQSDFDRYAIDRIAALAASLVPAIQSAPASNQLEQSDQEPPSS